MTKIFLLYFLFAIFFHPLIAESIVAWGLLVIPSFLFLAWLAYRFVHRQALPLGINALRQGLPYDWQWLFVLFALGAPLVALARGNTMDAAAVCVQTLLLVLLISLGRENTLNVRFAQMIFLVSCAGSVASYHLGLNDFGYFPWQERGCTFEGIFRVSLYPNLPDSAFFSLIVLLVSLYYRSKLSVLVIPLAAYFAYFSYSRTALMVIAIVVIVELLVRLRVSPNISFMLITTVLVSTVLFAGTVTSLLSFTEQRLTALMKGATSTLASASISKQSSPKENPSSNAESAGNSAPSYVEQLLTRQECAKSAGLNNPSLSGRANLWRDHLVAFGSSPFTGAGREGTASRLTQESSFSSRSGSESFFTRILAEFGIVALLFWAAIWRLFVFACKSGNGAARGLVAALLVILALYGSSATPYSFLFLIHIGLIGYVFSDKTRSFRKQGIVDEMEAAARPLPVKPA
ncbi:O-antigen ligase family protein [Laribacter hongkongensis]|uniref:O-antigen ligase family protein n=1 Tax=Laribacter hongkongensis TaxID=168471 RepID=A0ABD4SS55_9NEIS|nr:O-antigen ligase family protein [Laribacter hongkongensis]MCG9026052.1 O-antigen ligase family protein [Laribacter hongkongensis]MCG9124933.1 O-antigen ligase family protein [Laribacter hongkongensis]